MRGKFKKGDRVRISNADTRSGLRGKHGTVYGTVPLDCCWVTLDEKVSNLRNWEVFEGNLIQEPGTVAGPTQITVDRALLEKLQELALDNAEDEVYAQLDEVLHPIETGQFIVKVTGRSLDAQMVKAFDESTRKLFDTFEITRTGVDNDSDAW